MKSFTLCSLSIAALMFGFATIASAEDFKVIEGEDGTVYQVDLDDRSEYVTDAGWRHVRFWLSTRGDSQKHRSIASCQPYQVKSEYYNFDWLPDGGGYPAGTLGGEIARAACSN